MKIGIIGEPERASAWEPHMRSIQGIREVVLARQLSGITEVDGVVLLPGSSEAEDTVVQAIRRNWHVFLISGIPSDPRWAEKMYYLAEEANVVLQFSHWPTLSPASQQMFKKVPHPRTIQVSRELQPTRLRELDLQFEELWADEVGFCVKWMNSNVKRADAQHAILSSPQHSGGGVPLTIQIFLRFDNGGFASIHINAASKYNIFKRYGADRQHYVESDVLNREIRIGEMNEQNRVFFQREKFDPSETAPLALHYFIKAIKMKQKSLFNGFDLLQLNRTLQQVRNQLED